jgi:hypothetical protein
MIAEAAYYKAENATFIRAMRFMIGWKQKRNYQTGLRRQTADKWT